MSKKELNEDSKKILKGPQTLIKWITLLVIFYFLASYIGKSYLPAIGLNYFYYLVPSGKFFNFIPQKSSVFHSLDNEILEKNNKFFKYDQEVNKYYYELPRHLPSFFNVLKSLFSKPFGSINVEQVENEKIYILDANCVNPLQKSIMMINAGLQLLTVIFTTFFNSCLNLIYLLFPTPNTSFLFSPTYVYEKISPDYKKTLFNGLDEQIAKNSNNKIILGGWNNFKNFMNYIGLLATDQLTYSSTYFSKDMKLFEFDVVDDKLIPKSVFSIWWNRIKYFLTLFLPYLILFNVMRGDLSNSMIITSLVIIIYFGMRIFNVNYNSHPFYDLRSIYQTDFNKVADKLRDTANEVYKLKIRYTNDSIKSGFSGNKDLTEHEKMERKLKIKPQSGGLLDNLEKSKKLQDKIKEFRKEIKEYLKQ